MDFISGYITPGDIWAEVNEFLILLDLLRFAD